MKKIVLSVFVLFSFLYSQSQNIREKDDEKLNKYLKYHTNIPANITVHFRGPECKNLYSGFVISRKGWKHVKELGFIRITNDSTYFFKKLESSKKDYGYKFDSNFKWDKFTMDVIHFINDYYGDTTKVAIVNVTPRF